MQQRDINLVIIVPANVLEPCLVLGHLQVQSLRSIPILAGQHDLSLIDGDQMTQLKKPPRSRQILGHVELIVVRTQ